MEGHPSREDIWTPEEIEADLVETEPELFRYMQLLPRELWGRHFGSLEQISREHQTEGRKAIAERRINYILTIVQARKNASIEYDISDPLLSENLARPEQMKEFGDELHMLLVTEGNYLGSGKTARIKSLKFKQLDNRSIAVKYLLTPTAKTLSAKGEYDMIREAETITAVEDAEKKLRAGEHIRVPHPYFHYKQGKLQCYGMTEVNGITLEQLLRGSEENSTRNEIIESLKRRFGGAVSPDNLLEETDVFMRAVHEVCLHGDLNLRNIMIDRDGMIYLIDFGQSVPINSMSEETREQFENIQELERGQMRECIRQIWKRVLAVSTPDNF